MNAITQGHNDGNGAKEIRIFSTPLRTPRLGISNATHLRIRFALVVPHLASLLTLRLSA